VNEIYIKSKTMNIENVELRRNIKSRYIYIYIYYIGRVLLKKEASLLLRKKKLCIVSFEFKCQ